MSLDINGKKEYAFEVMSEILDEYTTPIISLLSNEQRDWIKTKSREKIDSYNK